MRQALNSNPVVQMAVLGVLVVVVGLFLMMNLKKGGSSGSTAASPTPATSSSPSTGSTSLSPTTSGTVSPEALVPGAGLPRPVVKAWKGGDAVVLLVVRGGGIDDKLVRGSARSLSGESGVALFVTQVGNVARYSRITQGVGLDHTPALVVVHPRRGADVPRAQVSYGFRSTQSVVQAVHDALYKGPDGLPYYPK